PHVPARDELHSIRIDQRAEGNDVVQETESFRIAAAVELVDRFDELLRPKCFCGMKTAVNPDYGLPFGCESAGLIIRQALGKSETSRDLPVVIEALEIVG